MSASIEHLQQRIGYQFRDPSLLTLALTHPSWLQDHPEASDNNQRLEFLGDAVLQLILTEALYALYPSDREGALSKRRAALSKGNYLALLAGEIDLAPHLLLATSEEQTGGRHRAAALEDAFESLLGAIYADSGYESARDIILKLYGDLARRLSQVIPSENPKGRLQERIQPLHGNNALRYEVDHIAGEDHAREYEARVYLQDTFMGSGRGTSKKAAEEAAAQAALDSDLLPDSGN
ncbi:ribonuclease III [Synoicihabitans lomoniglobus]|uniref:Ribonuclease 3 n=1 Tax=Synoicihabitans lomoniglobus TaxID=2909285 RepID=A0AAF0CRU0_9BACT|nr:ribonuclease III [Opitutaceae bacterium LMO-M01]WED66932.1 ribonuclease III [Opitutaceae bacterium LMO-M01]